MKNIKISLIVSKNQEIRKKISKLLKQIGISYLFESTMADALFRILDLNLMAVFVDFETIDNDSLEFIRLIKVFRKRVNVITITNPLSVDEYQGLLEAGSDHCFLKSARVNEILPVVSELMGHD